MFISSFLELKFCIAQSITISVQMQRQRKNRLALSKYYNTLTEANSFDAPKEGLGFRVDEYEPYVKKYSKDMGLNEDGSEKVVDPQSIIIIRTTHQSSI